MQEGSGKKASRAWIGVALAVAAGALGVWWTALRSSADVVEPSPQKNEPKAIEQAGKPATRSPIKAALQVCHDEALTAENVPIEPVEGTPAKVHGGELVDGAYDVTKYRVFGRPPEQVLSKTFRQTIVVGQNGTVAKNVRIGRRGEVETTIWSTNIEGSTLNLSGVCPDWVKGSQETVEFGVQGEELVMSFEQAGLPVVVTYRRRPG